MTRNGHTADATTDPERPVGWSSPPPDGQCHLFRLPFELRQTIFQYAYQQDSPYKVRTLGHWRRKQRDLDAALQRRTTSRWTSHVCLLGDLCGHLLSPFPASPLIQLTVCKPWFAEAVEAFFRAKVWHFDHQNDLDDFLGGEQACRVKQVRSVFLELEKVAFNSALHNLSSCCPLLESFTVQFNMHGIVYGKREIRNPRHDWKTEDIARLPLVEMALGCKRLRDFKLVNGIGLDAFWYPHWDANVKSVEAHVKKRLNRSYT